jgi:transposase
MDAAELAYVDSLHTHIGTLESENGNLKEANRCLEEQVAWFQRQLFGKRSEKVVPVDDKQLYLPGFEPPAEEPAREQEVKGHKRRIRKKGEDTVRLPPDIPVEDIILDIAEAEKICPETGEPLVKIGEQVTRKLVYKPGSYLLRRFIRFKYAKPKGEGIKTAELPDFLLPRCLADESLLAYLSTKKFADHLPLNRISDILSREKIHLSRQLLCQWILAAGLPLKPLKDEMLKKILSSGNIFIDETPIGLQESKKVRQAYMWVIAGGKAADPPYRVYEFRLSREHHHVFDLLSNYQGVMHSDKYGAYEQLAKRPQIAWVPCWSHIRRKFFESQGDPVFRKKVLRKIYYLFKFEQIAWARSSEERLRIRQEIEIPIIDDLIALVKQKLESGHPLPKSKLREALGYFYGLIPHLKTYAYHPYARLDNNVAERAVRPLAVGRKNWLFFGSAKGGEAASVILTLVQSCRALGINPQEYLEDVMRRFMSHNNQKLSELLPDEWAKARQGTQPAATA